MDVGLSRKGSLACRWRRSPRKPFDLQIATDGEWFAAFNSKISNLSRAGFNLGTHGIAVSANIGTPILSDKLVGRYIFSMMIRKNSVVVW